MSLQLDAEYFSLLGVFVNLSKSALHSVFVETTMCGPGFGLEGQIQI